MASQGIKSCAVHFPQPFPLYPGAASLLQDFSRVIVVEQNATGQFAQLLLTGAGIKSDGSILRFDGRPLTAKYIVDSYAALE